MGTATIPPLRITPTKYRAVILAAGRGVAAFNRGVWVLNQRPGVLLLFLLAQVGIVAFSWTLSLGLRYYVTGVLAGYVPDLPPDVLPSLREDAIQAFVDGTLLPLALGPEAEAAVLGALGWARYLLTSLGHLAALVFITLAAAAAVIALEAQGAGERFPLRRTLREAVPLLPPLLVTVLLVDYTLQGLRTLLGTGLGTALVSISPSLAEAFGGGTRGALAATGFIAGVIQVATVGIAALLVARLILAFPRRVFDETKGTVARPLAMLAALISLQAVSQFLSLDVGPVLVFGTNIAFLVLLALACRGRFPAGLEWSWKRTRPLLFVTILALGVTVAAASPQAWTALLIARGFDPGMAVLLYIFAAGGICYLLGAVRPLGYMLVGGLLAGYVFSVAGPSPLLLLPALVLMNSIPLAFFATALTELYSAVMEEDEAEGP